MENQPDEQSELTPETAAELWSILNKINDDLPAEDEGNNPRGVPRPKGHIPFDPRSDAEPPHQN